ncbi:MAG: hypothetical protein ACE366_06580 [Bradymonadia bacterium]
MKRRTLFKTATKMAATLLLVGQLGCYNTYRISWDELGKVQEGGESSAVKVKTEEGPEINVTANSKIGVTDKGGQYHQISPFNFTLTRGQLVAPDEDLLLLKSDVDTGNVKQVSGSKTALLVAAGVAILAGGVVYVVSTAEEADTFGQ